MRVDRIESKMLKETLYLAVLDNGLQVHVLPRKGYSKKHAAYTVRYGSMDTDFVDPASGGPVSCPDGIAHFLEHKMFEHQNGSVFDQFSRLGASANAYTDHASTTYVFSATENFSESLSTLLGFVKDPYFTDESVEKEKNIIVQELMMYRDIPAVQVEMNLLKALYHKNHVRVDIGGTPESVASITRDMLYTCYNAFYHPSNMSLFVTGDVASDEVIEQVERDQATRKYTARAPIARIHPMEPSTVNERRIDAQMSVALPMVLIGYKDPAPDAAGPALVTKMASGDILTATLFGRSSEAFSRLYAARLINDRFSASFDTDPAYSHATIGGESSDPERLVDEIRQVFTVARQDGLCDRAIARLKRKAAGEMVSLFNSLEGIGRVFNSLAAKGSGLFDYYDTLLRVTADDASRHLSTVFVDDNSAVSVVERA